ncbi:serine/threonine protein phosphatase [Romeria aff. gracilis LEGE 07310]|uniref:Serine/threonine protein phosphatase n=1 Tax=Vasconcelosia minhoensis LEGE 07310 TaxID=915328 RepID=A0A8J7ALH5_9CYAN|nr:metallophosphoesterase family protein [Romeria gracilis]MBE9080068.1 serine/threonine protein phosphatase [Romeria aff. gracilis LEGE 07310]
MTNPPRRIFIGDVHGHYDGLMQLFETIAPARGDQIYFVGDLIDRGPKSAHVIEFVRKNNYPCVLGNHEQLLLDAFPNGGTNMAAFQNWLYSGGQTTLASYSTTDHLLAHIEWLKKLPLFLDLGDIWLVHAGIDPRKPLGQQTSQDFCWVREPFQSFERPYFTDKLVIVGHTITFTLPDVSPGQIAQGPGWLGIDTGAYHSKSGWLTAVDIDNALVYQANVFQKATRTRSLKDAIAPISPQKIGRRARQPA